MLMYYNPETKQMTPVSEDDVIVNRADAKIVPAQVLSNVAAGVTTTPSGFEASTSFSRLSVILKAVNNAEVSVQWSFDGIAVDAEELLFYLEGDREPKTVHVVAPYFRIISTNTHTSAQAITIKGYLTA